MSDRPTREAAFDSRCAGCDGQILAGDTITLLVDDGEWVCERCADEADE